MGDWTQKRHRAARARCRAANRDAMLRVEGSGKAELAKYAGGDLPDALDEIQRLQGLLDLTDSVWKQRLLEIK